MRIMALPMGLLFIFLLSTLLTPCHSGNLGRESAKSANDINGHPEDAAIVFVEEDLLPHNQVPVVLDILNPNEELFEVEGTVADERIYTGTMEPWDEYYVTRIMYGEETLWVAEDNWECTYAEVFRNGDKVLIITGFKKGRLYKHVTIRRDEGGDWEAADSHNIEELIEEVMGEWWPRWIPEGQIAL